MEDVLSRVSAVSGVVTASVVGLPGGQVLSVFPASADVSVVAGAATDVHRVVSTMSLLLASSESLDDIVLTFSGSYHVLRPLSSSSLLLVTLDRSRTNLALARRQLRDVA